MASEKICKVLTTSCPSTLVQEQNQRRMMDALSSHKVYYEEIDGANTENHEVRNKLFTLSGKRAVYPQCFLEANGAFEFIADWEVFEGLLECEDLPEEILKANPTIKTFSVAFSGAKRN